MAQYEVKGYDSISRIANLLDYNNWKTLWDENPELQGKRNNPNILFHGVHDPDDRSTYLHEPDKLVYLPEDEREESVQTSTHASFGAVTDQLWLRFRIVDDEFSPFADATYKMDISGREIDSSQLIPDGDGVISVKLKPNDIIAKLTVTYPAPPEPVSSSSATGPVTGSATGPATVLPDPVSFEVWFQVGGLNPILDKSPAPDDKFTPGVQQRLNNLGFNAGSVTGVTNSTTESAIRRFQKRCNITEESGGKPIAGPQTQDWLQKLHDKPGTPPAPDSTGESGGSTAAVVESPAATQPAIDQMALDAAERRYQLAVQNLENATKDRKAVFERFRKDKSGEGLGQFQAAQRREAAAKEDVEQAKRELDRANRGI